MFFDRPSIKDPLDAFEEISQVQHTLDGMSLILCDMSESQSGAAPQSMELLSYLCRYGAETLDAASDKVFEFYKEHQS